MAIRHRRYRGTDSTEAATLLLVALKSEETSRENLIMYFIVPYQRGTSGSGRPVLTVPRGDRLVPGLGTSENHRVLRLRNETVNGAPSDTGTPRPKTSAYPANAAEG